MVQATDSNKHSGPYENSISYIKIKSATNGIYVDKVENWFSHCFVPEAKKCFFADNNITFNTFLNVDSAPYHPHIFQYYHLNPLPVQFKALLHGQKGCVFFQWAFKFTYCTRNRSPLQGKKS